MIEKEEEEEEEAAEDFTQNAVIAFFICSNLACALAESPFSSPSTHESARCVRTLARTDYRPPRVGLSNNSASTVTVCVPSFSASSTSASAEGVSSCQSAGAGAGGLTLLLPGP